MGLIHTDLKLTNLFSKNTVKVKAMVDTGSMHMCIPPEVARELGFDIEEMPTMLARVADGRLIRVPAITPVQIDTSRWRKA